MNEMQIIQPDEIIQPGDIQIYKSTRLSANKLQSLRDFVTDGLTSDHSKRAYGKAIDQFITWYEIEGDPGLSKSTVQKFKSHLQDYRDPDTGKKLSPATINQRLSAIRKLGNEAADNGLLPEQIANGIKNAKGVTHSGVRTGNWLNEEEAQRLLKTPDIKTLKGLRDRAILAIFLGTGLRCSELNSLTIEHVQQRNGRWVVVNLNGKRNKRRTVGMPAWTKAAIDTWTTAAGITEGRLFKAIDKSDKLAGKREVQFGKKSDGLMSAQGIANIVTEYGKKCGYKISAHDLRRTYAKLAEKAGARIEQIQLNLGHESLETTQKYLGGMLDYDKMPGDYIDLKIE